MARTLLLDADPELAARVRPDAREAFRHALVVEVRDLDRGPWVPDRTEPPAGHIGYMVLSGLMVRELRVGDARSLELLNQFDILRPWQEDSASFCEAEWRCLTDVRLAVLSPEVTAPLCREPGLVALLVDRALRRSRSLAVHAAIESVVGLERRLTLLFWHLAEHWGKRTGDGVEVPLDLTHETVALLVGARRPSVSAALTRLGQAGMIERRPGGWVLYGDPPGLEIEVPAEVVEAGEPGSASRSTGARPRKANATA
jgi:hypothetical protein